MVGGSSEYILDKIGGHGEVCITCIILHNVFSQQHIVW